MKYPLRVIDLKIMMTVVLIAILMSMRVPIVNSQVDQPVKVEVTTYEGNPILIKGEAGEWDSGFVFAGHVIYKDGTYHMFYTGGENFAVLTKPRAVGYATSKDGLTWTKYANNPILKIDPSISKEGIPHAVPLVDGNTWSLYFNDRVELNESQFIYRATASSPTGPWTIDKQPVLQIGGVRDWDRLIDTFTVLRTPDQYVLYYTNQAISGIGMATSPDGITWTKYNDPTTTKPPFANSDYVFTAAEPGAWDSGAIIPAILYTDHGWEMFYDGTSDGGKTWNLGFATSNDGISWNRFGDKPVMAAPSEYQSKLEGVLIVDNKYYIYHDMFSSLTSSDIGVSIATVTYK